MVTSNDLVLRRSRIESSARWARIRKPRDKWGEITRLIRGDFTPCMAFRTGDPGPTLVIVIHDPHLTDVRCRKWCAIRRAPGSWCSTCLPGRRCEIGNFWNKEHGETNGWVVRFTKIHRVFTRKWRAVLCATYLATFCVLHLPDRIRLHSVWSSGSVGGIYLNIFESGFSLRQSWQVWKLIGTSHICPNNEWEVFGGHWQSGRGSMSTKIYLHMCFFMIWKLYTHTGNSESTQNMK